LTFFFFRSLGLSSASLVFMKGTFVSLYALSCFFFNYRYSSSHVFLFFFLDEPRSIAGTSSWIIQSSTGSSSLTEFHTYGNLLCVYLLFRLISIAEKDMNT